MNLYDALELLAADQICIHLLTEHDVTSCLEVLCNHGFVRRSGHFLAGLISVLCREVNKPKNNGVVIYGGGFDIGWNRYSGEHVQGRYKHTQVPIKFTDSERIGIYSGHF